MRLGDIPRRLSEINAALNSPVILACKTDKRSAQAAKLLGEADFQDLQVLRGGMELWDRNGFEISKSGANQ